MKDLQTQYTDTTSLEAEFSIPYRYEIHFTNNLFDPGNELIRSFFNEHISIEKPRILIMIDQGVADHHPGIKTKIKEYFKTVNSVLLCPDILILPGGEIIKNKQSFHEQIIKAIDENRIDRHSYVIAIGGGAVLDAVGYAAAISHRGIRHIRIPTTVLSQNDSGIGVKNGINHLGKKNFLGSFAPPVAVWNDFQFLDTLSPRDKRAGLAEAVKVALIRDASFFQWLESNAIKLNAFDEKALNTSIYKCARLHLDHITTSGDPFERGSARPLDFGHWAAHKLEDLTGYEIRHGEAVAVGIMVDSIYAHLSGFIESAKLHRILDLFEKLGFQESYFFMQDIHSNPLLEGLEEFREHLGGKLTITLLEDIGKGFEVHEIDHARMKEAFSVLNHQLTANED